VDLNPGQWPMADRSFNLGDKKSPGEQPTIVPDDAGPA